MLLVHGARSVLRAAAAAAAQGKRLEDLRAWALALQQRSNHNKATCALANKLARIAYACLRDSAPYGQPLRAARKIDRQSFATPALAMPA